MRRLCKLGKRNVVAPSHSPTESEASMTAPDVRAHGFRPAHERPSMTTRENSMPTVTREISLGDLLKTGVLAVAVVTYLVKGGDKTEFTQAQFSDFKTDVSSRLEEIKRTVSPMNVLTSDVSTLKDDMKQAKSDIIIEDRLARGVRSDLDALARASAPQFPPPPEHRR
jgi:hypothetical protein